MVSGKPSITPLKADDADADDDDVNDGFLGVVRNFLATSAARNFGGGDAAAADDPPAMLSKTKLQSQSSVVRSSKKDRCI